MFLTINTRHRNNTINTNTKESIAKGIYTKSKNGTLARSDECIEKMINTRKSNGTVNTRTFDNIEKQRKTILDTGNNNFIKNNPSKQKKICPYCNQETASGGQFYSVAR